ncbi:MAG TPA: GFA family protein [Polyangiaceae bacterium]|jgi:hypothetical protein|nr:GFA family protein [Polyangiaceae bacterium]
MSHSIPTSAAKKTVTRTGGCHCGAVRFEVDLEEGFQAARCNCSICMKIAQTGVILKPSAFRLLAGEASIGRYAWGMKISTRHFCRHCGVHCFGSGHLAEIGGDFVSANLNCLDGFDVNALTVLHWDGRHDNWMVGPRSTPFPIHATPVPEAADPELRSAS